MVNNGFCRALRRAAVVFFVFGGLLVSGTALSQTDEQIRAKCRQAVTPQVVACMQAKKGTGNHEANLAACKASVTGAARACYMREAQKVAATKGPPPAPKDASPPATRGAGPLAATAFVAPPRTVADITAILDDEKPDENKIAERKADADKAPPKGVPASDLAQFYYDRGNSRALLARNKEALADGLRALENAIRLPEFQLNRVRQFVALQQLQLGDPKNAIATAQQIGKGALVASTRLLVQTYLSMGDVGQADTYARKIAATVQEWRGSPHPMVKSRYRMYGNSWEAELDSTRAAIFEARGQYHQAEDALKRVEAFRRASLKDLDKYEYPPPPEQMIAAADTDVMTLARVKAKQGRLAEAESDARRALLSELKTQGKYNPITPTFIIGLAGILVEQGRYEEAEKLTCVALEIERTLGFADDAPATANVLSQLGNILTLERKLKEAGDVFAQLEKAVATWEPQRRDVYLLNSSRIAALYASGQLETGIAAAKDLIKRQIVYKGENHFDTAAARGTLAIGLAKAGKDAEALREFKVAIPVLLAGSRENAEDEDPTLVAARAQRLQVTIESYIGLLARGASSNDIAVETFTLADAVRGRSVQQALAASSARTVAKDPALQDLVRQEQDLGKEINAELGTLNNALALPSGEHDDRGIAAINATIMKLRVDRDKTRTEINRRFPNYADLVDPRPPSVDQIKATLRQGEALISFYFGQDSSFVWAVPKDGTVAFASVPLSALTLEVKVRKLREALEPQVATVGEIPPFDLALGYELYAQLLKPVEEGWRPAKDLIVVTNGALGLLPLSLLPTAASEVNSGGPLFAGYKAVPWLARTHAVTLVPSVAALRTLRALPPGKPARDKLIGFGDPLFSKKQAEEAAKPVQIGDVAAAATTRAGLINVRGLPLARRSSPQLEGVASAELAMLPRLPDTADELKAIALALEADPTKVLNLGKDANESKVKSLDLSGYKILAFATHGLVPGDLNGLHQPALALSAPEVSGTDGDGLLTMEEILALKLDADWVVLSACNTAAGAGAGAEAASGLGRAFFYAGTRAILVTNWSVHSASARELVSDLFRRQAKDSKITRGEALQQATLAMIDGNGFTDEAGNSLFSYAHPLFWAPYSIIGDGGVN
jgi:CHAT domain-containing protein